MPITGRPTCATRCGSARPSPPPAPNTTPPSSRSAPTRCSPTPSPTPWSATHHHSIGTLQRDTDDTVTFHTNLNATHTTHPPTDRTPARAAPMPAHHPLAAHPPLDGHHRSRRPRPAAREAAELNAESSVGDSGRRFRSTGSTSPPGPCVHCPPAHAGGSWLVLANADLGAEIGRILGGNSSRHDPGRPPCSRTRSAELEMRSAASTTCCTHQSRRLTRFDVVSRPTACSTRREGLSRHWSASCVAAEVVHR